MPHETNAVSEPARTGVGEIVQAIALLLPPIALAWPGPGAFLASDMAPHVGGAGIAALATLPAMLVMLARRAAPKVRALEAYLLPLLIGVVWFTSGHASDTLESSRALMVAITGLALMLGAASLGDGGRAILARGAVLVSLVLLVTAFAASGDSLAGALGNTGSLAQAALLGAVIGARFVFEPRPLWRFVGGATWAAFASYCVHVPVLSCAAAAAVALAATALVERPSQRSSRAGLLALAILPIVALGWRLTGPRPERAQPANVGTAGQVRIDDTSGAGVRALIARSSFAMLRDHAWTGVGPGQFAVAFPPYRDSREIELSSLGRRLAAETEVEHAHDDWLEVVCESGVLGGLAWIAFLLTAGATALTILRHGTSACAAFATATIAVLVSALGNATFTHEPLASCFAFLSLGALLSRAVPARIPVSRRFVCLAAVALLVMCAPRAYRFVQHGRALAAFAEISVRAPAPRIDDADREAAARELQRALTACPDSVLARSLAARESHQFDGMIIDAFDDKGRLSGVPSPQVWTPAEHEALWRAVLALRPHRFEAWMQLGVLAGEADRADEARACFEKALTLDPTHPGVLENLVILESSEDRIDAALAYLDMLQAAHPPGEDWVRWTAARLAVSAHDRAAEALFARVDPSLASATPEQDYARAKTFEKSGDRIVAVALASRAHRGWARQHAAAGHWNDAVRSYRQAQNAVRDLGFPRVPRLELELAAALVLAGREDEAHELARGLAPRVSDWDAIADWARDRLRDTGWFER